MEVFRYVDSKSFYVEAYEDNKVFFAWEYAPKKVMSLETIPGNYPRTTIVAYESMEDFVEETLWLPWIVKGIKDDELLKLVKEKQEREDDSST